MSTEPGSEFSLWRVASAVRILNLKRTGKIVQQWYFDGQEEMSVVTIKLHPDKSGTSIELKHTNIPDEVYEEMVEGWNEMYFGSLMEFYDE